jgi:hypothetical protein
VKTDFRFDDRLLPSTSNALERGNRLHRKMQKTVYRVRTQEHIINRIALDMLRDGLGSFGPKALLVSRWVRLVWDPGHQHVPQVRLLERSANGMPPPGGEDSLVRCPWTPSGSSEDRRRRKLHVFVPKDID